MMNNYFKLLIVIGLLAQHKVSAQSTLNIYPDSLSVPVNKNLTAGVFFVPKTTAAASDFFGNSIQQNSIRTNVIEIALNNASNLPMCLSLLNNTETYLKDLSKKCDKLIFIFEKMPAWLSSSKDGSPASTLGWYVLNTKPPSNWNTWQTVVDSMTSKIVKQFGISNAYFEVWNEPDLGSWTGTMNDYFRLYRSTFDGIKSVNSSIKVGGPAVNFWANNIYWQPPSGYISHAKADSSLIGQLLDSAVVWKKIPDFISWHNFNISYQEFAQANNYIQQKLIALSLPKIPLILSEWNAPSSVRDTRLATAFMLKAQVELSKTAISNNVIAAWQDFTSSQTEFHNDYGLLTYGGIHKPAYNAVLLSEKLRGTTCKMTASVPFDGLSTVFGDTLFVLISNYCPPPFVEAINNTLYQGRFNVNQLDSAKYIDIKGRKVSRLDSIYRKLIVIPNSNALQMAVNNSINVYRHYDSIATSPRRFNLKINGYTGNYWGQLFLIDSTKNNGQFKYDSLLKAGFTQASAIPIILSNQNISFTNVPINAGQHTLSLPPNAVCLLKIKISKTTGILENSSEKKTFHVYPNPSSESLKIEFTTEQTHPEVLEIYDSKGGLVKTIYIRQPSEIIDISGLSNGFYFIQSQNSSHQPVKFIKQ